ncbi:MAG: PilZ domain-containing protein [Armatimonadota bacterium]|nr:PilZ domain-containing protein [Armatimonadota bacterium]
MHRNSTVCLGERVVVEVLGKRYGTEVEAVDDRKIVIAAPLAEDGVPAISPGEVVRVFFSRSNGLYYYEGEVLQQYHSPPRWLLGLSSDVQRIQRRDYVRIPVFLDARVQWRPDDTWKAAHTKDISGGGVCLILGEEPPLRLGDIFALQVALPDGGPPIATTVEIRRIEEKPENSTWLVGCAFSGIREVERQRIIRFVFRLEVQARRHSR